MVSKIGGKDKSFFLPGKPIIKIFASLQKNPGQTKWVCPGTGNGTRWGLRYFLMNR